MENHKGNFLLLLRKERKGIVQNHSFNGLTLKFILLVDDWILGKFSIERIVRNPFCKFRKSAFYAGIIPRGDADPHCAVDKQMCISNSSSIHTRGE